MMNKKIAVTIFILLVLLNTSFVCAEEKAKTGADPTDFITRIEPSYEHVNLEGGSSRDLFVVRADVAIRRDLSFRLDIPLSSYDPGTTLRGAGFDEEFGTGDLVSQIIYKPFSNEKGAVAVGMRIDWPIGSADELTAGGIVYSPMLVGAWFPAKGWGVYPVLQWNLADNLDNNPLPGDSDKNELSYRQIFIYQPMTQYVSWLMLDPELIIDFENDDKTSLDIGLEYGKMINKNIALFCKPTIGVNDSDKDWAVKVGFRYMFHDVVLFK